MVLSFVDFPLDLVDLLLDLIGLALGFANLLLDLHRTVEVEVKESVQALLEVVIEAEDRQGVVGFIRGPARLEKQGMDIIVGIMGRLSLYEDHLDVKRLAVPYSIPFRSAVRRYGSTYGGGQRRGSMVRRQKDAAFSAVPCRIWCKRHSIYGSAR